MSTFDAHVVAPEHAVGSPLALAGAVLYGLGAARQLRALCAAERPGRWLHAEPLGCLVGPSDPRFPSTAPAVIDLRLPEAELPAHLRRPPADWWPLANGAALNRQFLRLSLPPGAGTAASVRKLVRSFPQTRFVVDSFRHGRVAGWQAQVRLAECDNVWLTTLGLAPGTACRWPQPGEAEEAFYFAAGEVGAGRLLFASGQRWDDLLQAPAASEWLQTIQCLDRDQRTLILEANARGLFG